jgi:DMSO reductase anchor subunit
MLAKAIAQGKLARLCMLGARVIVALGLIATAVQAYILWQTYQTIESNTDNGYVFPGLPNGFIIAPVTYRSAPSLLDLSQPLAFLLAILVTTIFYALLLYVIGRVLHALSAEEKGTTEALEPDEERIIFQPLDGAPKQSAPRF